MNPHPCYHERRRPARLAELGGTPMPVTPPEFRQLLEQEIEKWPKVVAFSGASVDEVGARPWQTC
jgi:hypothetical protein